MNRFIVTINPTKVEHPILECSIPFDDQLTYLFKEGTSLGIDILKADKEFYNDGEYEMVRYTFNDLTPEKSEELEWFAKKLCIYFNHAINQNLN